MPRLFLLFGLLSLSILVSAQRVGKDYAVFFYVTNFQPGWAKLPETAIEAKQLKTELETNFGFTCELVANPNKDSILAKLRAYNGRLTPNDQILLFFSMHGHYEEMSERGFLIAADGVLNDDYGDTWLSYDDLSGYLARCNAKHVLLALDACHSGAFGIRNKARPEAPTFAQAEDCAQRVARMLQYSGRQFCSSGNKDSKTPAKSLFANRFLEALRKGGEDGIVCFDDLEYYLGKVENPKPESGSFKGHEPGGDFVFVRKNGCLQSRDRDGDGILDSEDKCPDVFGIRPNNGCPENSKISGNPDADYDGIPDAEDKCPDKYGTKANLGCPEKGISITGEDADYDGVPDDRDACPTEYGIAKANGCPDRDNDGVPDKSDKCKTDAGEAKWQGCPDSDGDGLPDHEDNCPNQKGLVEEKGCMPLDSDKDGVPDKSDMCKTKVGAAKWQGCPDSDADGLPDHEDQCPDQKGLAVDKGCPPSDRDKDGVPDKSDICKDIAGEPRWQGCPDSDGDGLPDHEDSCPKQKGRVEDKGCPSINGDMSDSESVELMTFSDSLNFAHGVVAGENAKAMLGKDFNIILYFEALNAVLKGEPTKFTTENASKVEQEIPTRMWKSNNAKYLEENKKRKEVTTTTSGLQYEVMKRGTGSVSPKATDKVEVHYHGTLYNGTIFDSSVQRGKTATFPLNGVIPGWVEGLQLMKEGDKFKFFIPYNLAYGEKGTGKIIKGYSTLIFEVELIKVNP